MWRFICTACVVSKRREIKRRWDDTAWQRAGIVTEVQVQLQVLDERLAMRDKVKTQKGRCQITWGMVTVKAPFRDINIPAESIIQVHHCQRCMWQQQHCPSHAVASRRSHFSLYRLASLFTITVRLPRIKREYGILFLHARWLATKMPLVLSVIQWSNEGCSHGFTRRSLASYILRI